MLLRTSLGILILTHQALELEFLRVRCLPVRGIRYPRVAIRHRSPRLLCVLLWKGSGFDIRGVEMDEHEHDWYGMLAAILGDNIVRDVGKKRLTEEQQEADAVQDKDI